MSRATDLDDSDDAFMDLPPKVIHQQKKRKRNRIPIQIFVYQLLMHFKISVVCRYD